MQGAHTKFPTDLAILMALLSISRDRGDVVSALRYAEELWQLHPGDVQLALLIRELKQQPPQ